MFLKTIFLEKLIHMFPEAQYVMYKNNSEKWLNLYIIS